MYCVYRNSGWYIHGGLLFGGGPLLGGSVIGGSTVDHIATAHAGAQGVAMVKPPHFRFLDPPLLSINVAIYTKK